MCSRGRPRGQGRPRGLHLCCLPHKYLKKKKKIFLKKKNPFRFNSQFYSKKENTCTLF